MLTRGEDVPAFAEAAYQSSLYSAIRRTRRAWGLMPWERGPVLGTSVPLPRPFAMPVGPMPLMPVGGDAVSNEEEGEHPKPAALFELASKFVRRHETVAWETRLAGARSAAIHKWLGLIKLDPMCFDVARAYMAGLHTQQQNGSLTQTLVNAFATKSSATQRQRCIISWSVLSPPQPLHFSDRLLARLPLRGIHWVLQVETLLSKVQGSRLRVEVVCDEAT